MKDMTLDFCCFCFDLKKGCCLYVKLSFYFAIICEIIALISFTFTNELQICKFTLSI